MRTTRISLITKIMVTKMTIKGKTHIPITTTEELVTTAIKTSTIPTTRIRNLVMQLVVVNTMTITSLMATLTNNSSNLLITHHLNPHTRPTQELTMVTETTIIKIATVVVATTTHIQKRATVATINLALITTMLLLLMSSISILLRTIH